MMMPILGRVDTGMVALIIPIISIIGGISIAVVAVIMAGRRKELEHRERLIAMEKGIELPPRQPKLKEPRYGTTRTGGLILLFVGVAITLGITVEEGFRDGVWGLIPASIGIAMLLGARMEKNDYEQRKNELNQRQ